eukprot:CAMPEP_0113709596 /NCGR_PEP_ID=MMETSP0038_2-20120614/29664_1 /TAXON_ID=2898 /ORGANISM="Cryptomonas paramecium" /LENGTH=206 /DNA_ID=CAMNT_0000635509 /DNA_START=34 /DNA_END=650 /DNA_ORIENTATION=- /assembly_acc=CAM_ASM_000170
MATQMLDNSIKTELEYHGPGAQNSDLNSESLTDKDLENEKEIMSKMSLVDWRWAARNGFWNKSEKKWNPAKGGFEGYLKQRKLGFGTQRSVQKCQKNPTRPVVKDSLIKKAPVKKERNGKEKQDPGKIANTLQQTPTNPPGVVSVPRPRLPTSAMSGDDIGRFVRTPIQRYWSFGYRVSSMKSMFDALPFDVAYALERWVFELQRR